MGRELEEVNRRAAIRLRLRRRPEKPGGVQRGWRGSWKKSTGEQRYGFGSAGGGVYRSRGGKKDHGDAAERLSGRLGQRSAGWMAPRGARSTAGGIGHPVAPAGQLAGAAPDLEGGSPRPPVLAARRGAAAGAALNQAEAAIFSARRPLAAAVAEAVMEKRIMAMRQNA